jgi:5-methylcytosine-specific restriction endonuclease McrA
MSAHDLKVLLDQVPDTRELVLRRVHRRAEHAAWRDAHEEAAAAYVAWRSRRTREAYAAYRAAQDREDAAQDILAGVR